ncbi:MAG: tetratricopeptide repeat protein, partial [Bacteroidales bacterium]|nr:tetratricopeptide repeat protein [Bacteroidales bacterium]
VYAIGLNSLGQALEAIKFLEASLKNHPYNREILYALSTLNIEQGNVSHARSYTQRLLEYYPNDQEVRQLANSIK